MRFSRLFVTLLFFLFLLLRLVCYELENVKARSFMCLLFFVLNVIVCKCLLENVVKNSDINGLVVIRTLAEVKIACVNYTAFNFSAVAVNIVNLRKELCDEINNAVCCSLECVCNARLLISYSEVLLLD